MSRQASSAAACGEHCNVGESVPVEYFVDLYRREIDPWRFETSAYEHQKYAATLAALPRRRYARALEIACSVGVFTSLLAQRCDDLLAIDVSHEALARARTNCRGHSHVRFERRAVPADFPRGAYDLITFCEMGFYLSMDDLRELRAKVLANTIPGAHIILVHWTPHVEGHATCTETVHRIFRQARGLNWISGYSAATYRLDLLERCA